jgi:hypothetical protein
MGSIGDCFDYSVAESFFGTLQLELLDEHHWESRQQLAQAIFEWIEAWYSPRRRHSYCQMLKSRGLRSRSRGMITNQQQLSAGAGEAHSNQCPHSDWTIHRGLLNSGHPIADLLQNWARTSKTRTIPPCDCTMKKASQREPTSTL